MKKSYKKLMRMIFVILLILFPLLMYATRKRGKRDIESLNSPFEKSDEPERDNNTKKIAKPKIKETKKLQKHKKQNSSLRKNISNDLQNKNSNGRPVISDPENINLQSSTNGADLEESDFEGSHEGEINEISNFPKNRSNLHKKSNDKNSLLILKQNKPKESKKLYDSRNKNPIKSSVIKNKNDSNEDQIKKITKNNSNGSQKDVISLSPETIKSRIDKNKQDKDNADVNKSISNKPQIKKVRPYEEILRKKPTDAEKIAWVIKKKNRKRKHRSPLYLKNVMTPIAEDDGDVIKLETEEPDTEENINNKRRTDTSGFSDFKYKIDKNLKTVWDSMNKFNEKEQFGKIYKMLYENKFKNGIQSVNKENEKVKSNVEGEDSKGAVLPKTVEKYKNEKRPTIGGVQNNNKIFNKPSLNNDNASSFTSKNPFDEDSLKNRVRKNMKSFRYNFTPDHWFIRFIEICHNFHMKHMAKNYYKLGQLYSEETSEDFFNWTWRNYLSEFGSTKNRYSPIEVAPFISMLHALNHHIRDSDRIYFTNAYRNYLERNVLENVDDNELTESIRQVPYYGILEMLNSMDQVKLSEANDFNRTNSYETAILNSNSSTGNTTDVSDYDIDLFG